MYKRLFVVAAFVVAISGMVGVSNVDATNDNDGVCGPLDSGKIDTPSNPVILTLTAPTGKLISGYCVKAGSIQNGNGPVYVTLNVPIKTVVFSHPSEKEISHYSLSYVAEVEEIDDPAQPIADEPGRGSVGETPVTATPEATSDSPAEEVSTLPLAAGDNTPVITVAVSAIATVMAIVSVVVKTALLKQ